MPVGFLETVQMKGSHLFVLVDDAAQSISQEDLERSFHLERTSLQEQ